MVQSERSDGSLVVTVGHPLADAWLEFLNARARPNTIRAVAVDLKVFFSFVDKTPVRVKSVDVMSFITAQRNGSGDPKVVRIDRSDGLSPRFTAWCPPSGRETQHQPSNCLWGSCRRDA